ncbi:integrase catalytic domain-containing protein [Trichonephila clavata]|uniref:Integrase catalytic domain-containing protein n=1 Tax=Trichonephila clavata TaxID=2740835 RepID=A0A8X6LSF9_TRICU|nr:integrase catalytic domain-containing protein [Trichonephila clavata]
MKLLDFPLASKVALQDVYTDHVVSVAQTLDTARQLQCQLQNMLKTCGMKLHKGNSNSKDLFNSSTDQEHSFSTNAESAFKTLGVSWKPTGDYFMFKVSIPSIASYTKRDVLSVIARLYDPLGLVGPVINKAKIFLQKLWFRNLNWEECLPVAIAQEWLNFVSSLKAIEELKIDRYLLTDSYEKLMLLGYADASESAYGALVYMHCVKEMVPPQQSLLPANLESRQSKSSPFLALNSRRACCWLNCSTRLCFFLQVHLDSHLAHRFNHSHYLDNTPANQLKTFVGNRVSKMTQSTLTENFEFKHIPSALNSADIISREVNPEELLSLTLWWNGFQHLDIPEQFSEPSINSSDELYMSELKKQSDISLT